MKKTLLLITASLIAVASYSQVKRKVVPAKIVATKPKGPSTADLQTSVKKLERESMMESTIKLAVIYKKEDYKPVPIVTFASKLENEPIDSIHNARAQDFFAKYKNDIIKYLKAVDSYGASSDEVYGKSFPIDFTLFNNEVVFYQGSLLYGSSLNSFKLDADARARLVVKNFILPSLKNFKPLLSTDIPNYQLTGNYLIKDFTDKSSYEKVELVSIIISKKVLSDYLEALLTDDDVINKSAFFTHNVDMGVFEIKKILVKP